MDATVDYKPFFLHRRRGFFDFFFWFFVRHTLSLQLLLPRVGCVVETLSQGKKKTSGAAESHSHHHCSRNVVVGKNKQRGSVRIIISSFSRELLPLFLRKKPTHKGTKKTTPPPKPYYQPTVWICCRFESLLGGNTFPLPKTKEETNQTNQPSNELTNY